VARTGKSMLVPHIDPDEIARRSESGFSDAVRELGMHSFLSVPLQMRGRRLGAISLLRYAPGSPPFDESDLVFAQTITDHAALAIANAQLVESLQGELLERRRAEEEAKTFVALIQTSTDFIAMATFEGRVLFVNDAGRNLVGLELDREVRDLALSDFHTPDGLSRAGHIREHGSWRGEGVLRHFKTGELMPTRVTSFLVRDADGIPMCFATVQSDLRETKRLESQLQQAQKMEALGRLAGGIAHDFNNLLTVILSYCSLLRRGLPPGSRLADDVAQISRAGERAADLTRQLLAFSRKQVMTPKPLDLGATVTAMERMIRPLIGEDIELRIAAPADLGTVVVDGGQIEQVVMNLAVNARDAMSAGGTLTITAERLDLDRSRALEHGVVAGTYAMLSVIDTGVGIDEQTRARVFDPFFTTKERGKGTGLGLSTVMGIVKQSGGHVTVDSIVGQGTTFRVYLPMSVAPVEVQMPVLPRTLTPMPAHGRILLVEDEDPVRILVRDVLLRAGYDVLDAPDGEQALSIAMTAGEVHLLLTDVIMPRMSGPQLAQRFLEARPGTRVLFMSGYTDDKLGQHGVLEPGVQLVQKPLTPEVLLRRVREVLK
jgi:PAS domain S-box-containing protein